MTQCSFLEPFESSRIQRKDIALYVDKLFEIVSKGSSSKSIPFLKQQQTLKQTVVRPPYFDAFQTTNISSSNAMRCIIRPISESEINTLIHTCQCTTTNNTWDKICIMYFVPNDDDDTVSTLSYQYDDFSDYLSKYYYQSVFAGHVILGVSKIPNTQARTAATNTSTTCLDEEEEGEEEDTLPMGVRFNTRIVNSILEPFCKVYHNTLIANTFIASSASIIHCGTIRWNKKCPSNILSSTLDISVGPETGGRRQISVTVESTMIDVMAYLQPNSKSSLLPWRIFSQSYENDNKSSPVCTPTSTTTTSTCSHNIILGSVSHIDSMIHVYCDFDSNLQSCPSITNTILLPHASITHGCIVDSCLVQWNASITNHSTVSFTLLMEQSHIGPNSVVNQTIIGPDSHVSCGEVHCSVIGPNTNAHHQSLIISTLWPLGRGNVAYGCNMGSNHTGRLPDQEMMSGEGMFYGLSTSFKFPIDLSRSPYSIIAAGISLPPQRVAMPFSLITAMNSTCNTASTHASQSQNEIVPGWVLHSSPYTVIRNELKFKTRRKAIRHSFYTGWTILRPSIIDSCFICRNALLQLKSDMFNDNDVYAHTALDALGLNVMTERGRKIGIQAYSNLIQRYALQGLFEFVSVNLNDSEQIDELVEALHQQRRDYDAFEYSKYEFLSMDVSMSVVTFPVPNDNHGLSHALFILLLEYPEIIKEPSSMATKEGRLQLLTLLFDKWLFLENEFVKGVKKSKLRDNSRGREIILDYEDSHTNIENDATVRFIVINMGELAANVYSTVSKLAVVFGCEKNVL